MKKLCIMTDSHSGILPDEAESLGIRILPMPFYIEEACFLEGVTLTRTDFFKHLAAGAKVATSQPAPAQVLAAWDDALLSYEEILYIPISSGLSGSWEAAAALALEEAYAGKVFVVDNGRVSSPLHCTVLDALALFEKGYDAAQIKEILERDRDLVTIYLAVETLEYLKRGGRLSPTAAALGSLLNIKPILKLSTGKLDSFAKTRGFNKAKHAMLDAIKQDCETVFKEAVDVGQLHILAAGSADLETTKAWIKEVQSAFPGNEVLYGDLSMAVCCHTGPDALGIGVSVKPKELWEERKELT